jgi:hypothetical protein
MTLIQGVGWAALGMAIGFAPSLLVADAPVTAPPIQMSVWERPAPGDPEEPDPSEPYIVELCVPEVVQVST